MKIYFVTVGRTDESEVIKALKPDNLLLSYYYFKNKNLDEWCTGLGYTPNILLDSGAFSAYNCNMSIDLNKYINYIKENQKNIKHYINLDVVGDAAQSYFNYLQMRNAGLKPIPVFHYKTDESYLIKYIDQKETYIALGGTVGVRNKQVIALWIEHLTKKYPYINFHLLGSTCEAIMDTQSYSCDSTSWIKQAAMGEPKFIKGKTPADKKTRASYNMLQLMKKQNQKKEKVYEQICMF